MFVCFASIQYYLLAMKSREYLEVQMYDDLPYTIATRQSRALSPFLHAHAYDEMKGHYSRNVF